jgi:hypothetical protein
VPVSINRRFTGAPPNCQIDQPLGSNFVVTERDFLGSIQAAPTRYIYPAKLEKARLERILLDGGGKTEEEAMTVGGKELKTRTMTGTIKAPDGEQVEFKLWLSDDVPGTIVKQVRTARQRRETWLPRPRPLWSRLRKRTDGTTSSMRGERYFDDFPRSPERLATNVLSARLRALCEHGLVEKTRDPADTAMTADHGFNCPATWPQDQVRSLALGKVSIESAAARN